MSHPPSPSRWVTGVLIVFTMFGFGFGNWLARIPATRDRLGASTFEMSLLGLVLAIGSIMGLVFAGRTVDWLGPRRAMVWSAVGQAIFLPLGAILLWFDASIPGACGLALYGFCFSTGDVAMNVSGANAERALGKSRMPLLHAGYSFGGVSAMGVGALAEAMHISVPLHLTIVAVVILLCTCLAARSIPRAELAEIIDAPPVTPTDAVNTNTGPIHFIDPETVAPQAVIPPPRYNPWRDPRIIVIGLIVMSMSLAEGTATDWLPLALTDNRGFTNTGAALTLGVFFVAMMLTRVAGGPLLDRFGRVLVLRACALCVIAAITIMNLVPHPWVSVAAAALWGIGSAFGFPLGISAAADDPKKAVRGVATVSAIAYGAFLMGPMLIGVLGEYFGLLNAFWPLIVFVAFAFVAANTVREPGARATP